MAIFAKEGDFTCEVYLAAVRQMACAFCGMEPAGQAHHWPPKGRGVTRDDLTIPVCVACHQRCHGLKVPGAPPISSSAQIVAVAHTLRRFVEMASPKEWDSFSRAREAWAMRSWKQAG